MSEHEPKPVAYIRDFGMRSLSEGTHTTVMPEVFLQYDIPLYPASVVTALQEEVGRLRTAIGKVNAIRNSIIGCQKMNWSEHIYPLVAALNEAGIEGQDYPEAREYVGTMLERTLAAEARANAAEQRLKEAVKVLEPFASLEPNLALDPKDDDREVNNAVFDELPKWGHLRAARAFIKEAGE